MKKINGLSIYSYGDSGKQPLIFVHGFPFDAGMWRKQIDELKEDYYCVAYDIRGLGASEKGDGLFTMEQFADDLFGVVDGMDLKKPVLISLSMGGYIAFRALDKNSSIFRAAIFCGTKSEADGNEGRIKRADTVKRINTIGAEAFIKEFIPNTFRAENITAMGNEYVEFVTGLLNTPGTSLKGCQLAMAGRTDSGHVPLKTDMPALFICGEHDTFSPPAVMKADAAKWPGSEFVLIRNAGHLSPFEQPGQVNKAIRDFLKKL